MARKGVDDLIKQKIRKAFLESPLDLNKTQVYELLADRFSLSAPTIKKICRDLGREGRQAVVSVRKTQSQPGIDFDQALLDAIDLMSEGASTPVKSGESAARAMAELIREYDRRNPQTVEQLVEYVLSHPAFTVQSFMKALRDRIEQTA